MLKYNFWVSAGRQMRLHSILVGECAVIESVKAAADIYCPLAGEVLEINEAVIENPQLINEDPYGQGWLYRIRGKPESNSVDVRGYMQMLDLTIDKMQEKAGAAGDEEPAGKD